MKRLIKTLAKAGACLAAALTLTACATWTEPLALAVCGPVKLELKYKDDGHLDTAYIVARHAGWDAAAAAELAFYTQAPDDFAAAYSAPSGSARLLALQFERAHLLSAVLHSLHGGGTDDVAHRQRVLAQMISEQSRVWADPARPGDHWKLGFLVHALGDSYAHVWGVNQNRPGSVAYNPITGHIPDGLVHGNPDNIAANYTNYAAYVRTLYAALDRGDGDRVALEAYLADVEQAVAREARGGVGATTALIRSTSTDDYGRAGSLDCPGWATRLNYESGVRPFLQQIEARLESR
ncbi:hypothetical protein [uncultured Maricaulis sp.]|uniref:hypothetical protein n=1 Tax=uncultured Maricaulis sp. TaxID=174710 RepID=UPI0030DC3C81|tara:strand:- start:105936 stop:106817 length:882 start_codon:yes stop_codon:yes gene_type:complete